MESQAKADGLDYGMFERTAEAVAWLKEARPAPARVRVVGDDDSDGTTSVFAVSKTLARAGYEVDVKIMRVHDTGDVDVAMAGAMDACVIADCGSAFLEYLDSYAVPTIVLDHHRVTDYEPENVFEVNPRRTGGDKVDFVSASIVSQLFAEAFDERNHATAFASLAGGIADRQHLSGFRGLIDEVVDRAQAAGHVTRRQGLTLPGRTVQQAIALSIDPYFDGLTGDEEATARFLKGLGVGPETDPRDLETGDARRVGDALQAKLAKAGVVTDRIYPPFGLMLPLEHPSGIPTVFTLTRLLETLTARKEFKEALAMLDGDAKAAKAAWRIYRGRVSDVLAEVDRMRSEVREMENIRVAETKDQLDTGIFAHTLLTYVFGDDKPFVAFTRSGGRVKFSARGSPRLYNAGVDLSIGMQDAGEAFGGNGGGHPGASGAAVDAQHLEAFLGRLDATLGGLRRKAAA